MARKKPAPGSNVVIENTRPCAVFLPANRGEQKTHRQRMLMPGENDVPADHLDAVKDNRAVKQYFALKWLVNHGEGKAKPLPMGLDGLSDAEAVSRLGQISDPTVVQDLRDRTQSAGLKELAQIRLRELIGGDEPEDSEG